MGTGFQAACDSSGQTKSGIRASSGMCGIFPFKLQETHDIDVVTHQLSVVVWLPLLGEKHQLSGEHVGQLEPCPLQAVLPQ